MIYEFRKPYKEQVKEVLNEALAQWDKAKEDHEAKPTATTFETLQAVTETVRKAAELCKAYGVEVK